MKTIKAYSPSLDTCIVIFSVLKNLPGDSDVQEIKYFYAKLTFCMVMICGYLFKLAVYTTFRMESYFASCKENEEDYKQLRCNTVCMGKNLFQ